MCLVNFNFNTLASKQIVITLLYSCVSYSYYMHTTDIDTNKIIYVHTQQATAYHLILYICNLTKATCSSYVTDELAKIEDANYIATSNHS